VNLQTIRDALLQMPWVEEVSIRRLWPPSLNIRVTEKRAVAYWGSDALISDKGVLFSPQPLSHQAHLPQLDGPELLHKKVWQFAAEVSTQLIKLGMHTEKVSLDERRAWRVYVARDGADNQQGKDLIEINFGSTDTEQRLQRFLHVFAMRKAPDLNNIQVVDMRYPNGFALRANNNKERGA
jgi:cell division protein FtsQ